MRALKLLILASFAVVSMLAATVVHANTKSVEHTIPMAGITHVQVHNAVGSVYITQGEGEEATLRVEFEGKRSGMLRRTKDVSDMDVTIQTRDDRVRISFQENNVEATFYLSLPAHGHLEVDMGVGMLDARVGATRVDVNMGVGDVTVRAPRESAGQIAVNAGVGAASIQGALEHQSTRAIVTERASGRGEGEYSIHADVGVGDVKVILE